MVTAFVTLIFTANDWTFVELQLKMTGNTLIP